MAGALAVVAQNAHGQILYNDTTTQVSSPETYFNQNNAQLGNEIVLTGAASQDTVTGFKTAFDFFGDAAIATGGVTADVKFYANTGPNVPTGPGGYPSPSTVLFDSGAFSLGGYTGTSASPSDQSINFSAAQLATGNTVNLTGPVPKDFTWTVTFSGLSGDQSAGLLEFAPPTVGTNFGDAWYNNGTGWQLKTPAVGGTPIQFYAEVFGTAAASGVPDASCLPVSALAVAAGLGCMKRFGRKA